MSDDSNVLSRPPPALVERVVDDFEAIRILALRLERREQSDRVRFDVGQGDGSSWRVEVECVDRDRRGVRYPELPPPGVLVEFRVDGRGTSEVALEVMSDVGALELAGHSIADPPLRPSWASNEPFVAKESTVAGCTGRIRQRIARALQSRVRDNAARLKADGFDFSADGWDLVTRFVWPGPSPSEASVRGYFPG